MSTASILVAVGCGGFQGWNERRPRSEGNEPWPSFCEPVAPDLLDGMKVPYSLRTTGNGQRYCEGILPRPIAAIPLRVVSVKQVQPSPGPFNGRKLTLTWCTDKSKAVPIAVRLRAVTSPLFAMDAEGTLALEWESERARQLNLTWDHLGALATQATGNGRDIFQPIRIGTGTTAIYSMLVTGATGVSLSQATLEQTDGAHKTFIRAVQVLTGPGTTIEAQVSFEGMPKGIYRVSLSGGIDGPGRVSLPIYLAHEC